MSTTSLRYPIFLALSGLLTQIQAGTPAWTYSAPNPASVTVSAGETTTVQYTVTNLQSHHHGNWQSGANRRDS